MINISDLKCGVYSRAALNRINTLAINCWLVNPGEWGGRVLLTMCSYLVKLA